MGWVNPIWKRMHTLKDALIYMIMKGRVPEDLQFVPPIKQANINASLALGESEPLLGRSRLLNF